MRGVVFDTVDATQRPEFKSIDLASQVIRDVAHWLGFGEEHSVDEEVDSVARYCCALEEEEDRIFERATY